MVQIVTAECAVCGRITYLYGSSDTCKDCEEDAKQTAKRRHFEDLDKMSLENRIRRIEKILYDEPWEHTHPELVRYR